MQNYNQVIFPSKSFIFSMHEVWVFFFSLANESKDTENRLSLYHIPVYISIISFMYSIH